MTEYGINELTSLEDADIDIVFVHGLFGNRLDTWTKNNVLWPQALLPTDVPNARILTFGYDADVVKRDSAHVIDSTMESHAADLCDALATLRATTKTAERPVIFVGHSLGGLLCAQVLITGDRNASSDNTAIIARCIKGMVFLGTPFRGSRYAKWADILQKIGRAFIGTNKNKLRDLEVTSDKLKILAEAFPEVLRKVNSNGLRVWVAFFIETLKYNKLLIVDEDSAWIPGCGDHATIRANHIEICKFDSKEDDGYKSVVGAIKKLVDMETTVTPSQDGGATFHNYGMVQNQVGRDQHITGGMHFGR